MDVRVLELLSSRICHDLISPVGAIGNGIEFLEDSGTGSLDEAMSLIKFSASQASARLQVFRYAYGAGGADASIKPEDIQKAFSASISGDGRITQSWDPYAPLGQSGNPSGFCKILMGCLMLAQEFLPRGGNVSVRAAAGGEGTVVTAQGVGAVMREGVADALARTTSQEALDTKTIHPYVVSLMAGRYGFSVASGETLENSVSVVILAK